MSNRHERRRAAKAAPTSQRPGLAAAQALAASGQAGEAFAAFEALLAKDPANPRVRFAFADFLATNTPRSPHPQVDALFRAALDQGWTWPEALAIPVATYLTAKARAAIDAALPGAPEDFLRVPGAVALAGDPLLHALMRATPAATPALDQFLARMRCALLFSGVRPELQPFVDALAARSALSGAALTLSEREAVAGERDKAAGSSLSACYFPVPDPQEAAIAAAIEPLTSIDSSNDPVQAQYEADPYPRWSRAPVGAGYPPPAAVSALLGDRATSVLVAGCGTGQHAVAAANRWPRAQVLAIDISRASLAHAIRASEALGVKRVRFALADLLAAGQLGQRFRVVEAAGVLHHLADPEAGLAALREALAPGGAMLVALYSRAARAGLAEARAKTGVARAETPDEIRAFRARALALGGMPEILYSPDFYSIGGCRDLMFHAREAAFTLAEVGEMLERQKLHLLALEIPAAAAAIPGPLPAANDLAGWADVEARHPLLFGAMPHLWVTQEGA